MKVLIDQDLCTATGSARRSARQNSSFSTASPTSETPTAHRCSMAATRRSTPRYSMQCWMPPKNVPASASSSTRNLDTAAALGRAVGVGAARVFWHAYLVDGSSPKKHEPEPGVPDSVRSDGRAAIAVTLLALFLIGFLISRLV